MRDWGKDPFVQNLDSGMGNGKSNGTGPTDPVQLLPLGHWLDRDLPDPDFMLGEVLSTTTRVMLVGPTGLGKTMFGLALAIALAAGPGEFLHWHIPKPRRVLYLDGEMSRRLMKKRIIDEMRRQNIERGAALFVLSREDFPDIPPLNTEAGQHFIDQVIEAIGGVDIVIIDNIQAWTVGDQREETTWEPCLPWIRSLTRREIAQVWIHHTGLDQTHSYGSSAREWQLDTVMLMEAMAIAGTEASDLSFRLSFPKARERTPDNRHDFEPASVTLTDNAWSWKPGGGDTASRKNQQPKLEDYALYCLTDVIAAHGEAVKGHPKVPPGTVAVTMDTWKRVFVHNYAGKAEENSKETMFYRYAGKLQNGGRVRHERPWVWPLRGGRN